MNVCIIGCRGHHGYVTTGLPLRPDARLVAISAGSAQDNPAPLVAACEGAGMTPVVYDDYRELFDREAPDIACISGPFETRADMCIEAFRRRIHVFAEKPVAIEEQQLTDLQREHRKAGVHFASMMGLRYDPAFYTAWQAVRDGRVGRVNLITTQKSYKLGTRPPHYSRRETYGGTIPWVGSHAIDWIRWFSLRNFASVMASQTRQDNRDNGTLEMAALCQFDMDDGTLASANIDFYRPERAPTHGDDRIRIAGANGVIEVINNQVHLIGDTTETLTTNCPRQVFADFLDHLTGDATALIDATDVFAVTRACLLAQRSADTGRPMMFNKETPT